MTKPDTLLINKEVFDVLSEACGWKDKDTHTPTNRKARRAEEADRRRSMRPPT